MWHCGLPSINVSGTASVIVINPRACVRSNTTSGGPGYSVDEKPPANLAYTKGTVAMAKSSADPPGRSGSQFYVVTAADAGLPPEYALVGKVDKGYDVVTKIEKLGTPEETPKQTVLIEKMTIEKG